MFIVLLIEMFPEKQLRRKTETSYSNSVAQWWNHLCNNNLSTLQLLTTPQHAYTSVNLSDYYKLTIHTLILSSKMPLQINNVKGEQCILYKYFKSIEISLIYVCVQKMVDW